MPLLLIAVALIIWIIVFVTSRDVNRTTAIKIVFGEIMPTPSTATVNDGNSLAASLVALLDNGTDSNGVISNASYTIDDSTVVTLVANADGTATLTGIKIGTANLSVTATVTDPDGFVAQFSAQAVVTVTAGPNDSRTVAIEILFSSVATPTATPAVK